MIFDKYHSEGGSTHVNSYGYVLNQSAEHIEEVILPKSVNIDRQMEKEFRNCNNLRSYSLATNELPDEINLSHWQKLKVFELSLVENKFPQNFKIQVFQPKDFKFVLKFDDSVILNDFLEIF